MGLGQGWALPWTGALALFTKEALQDRWAGGLQGPLGEASQSLQGALALCPAEALQGLSEGLPGLWKVGFRPWGNQVLCGEDSLLAEAPQHCPVEVLLAPSEEEQCAPFAGPAELLRREARTSGALQWPWGLLPASCRRSCPPLWRWS